MTQHTPLIGAILPVVNKSPEHHTVDRFGKFQHGHERLFRQCAHRETIMLNQHGQNTSLLDSQPGAVVCCVWVLQHPGQPR